MSIFDLLLPSSAAAANSGSRRRSFSLLEVLVIHLILSCTWFCNGTFEPYSAKEMPVNVDYNSYDMYEDAYNASVREPFISDLDPQCLNVNQMSYLGLSNTCHRSDLLCSQLQSSNFLSEEHHSRDSISRSSDIGKEELLESQKSDRINLDVSCFSLPMHLDINPHLLDWGNGYLHSRKLAFLTLTNRQKDNALLVYKPSSTDRQFYACNYSGSLLDAGEVVSICFVFHPKQLGLSSAQLLIQTSLGGFVVQGKGFAVSHPVEDKIIEMPGIPFSGRWGKIISLLSSINMTVYAIEFKSSLPGLRSSLFKKILRGLSVKKIYAVTFFAVSLIFLRHCFATPHIMQRISNNYLFLVGNNLTPTVSSVRNSTSMHQNQQVSGFPVSYKMDFRRSLKVKSESLAVDCIDNEHNVVATADSVVSQGAKLEPVIHGGDNISRKNKKRESVTSPVTKSGVVLNAGNGDSSNIGTIAVKVGKEKRRRKKGKGPRAGVAVSIESPGSQSGYSTPPTPMSPVTTVLLPNQNTCYAKLEKHENPRSPIKALTSHLSEKSAIMEKQKSLKANDMKQSALKQVFPDAPKQALNEPVFRSSAAYPAADHPVRNVYPPYFLPPSSVAPHDRAPGPKLCKKTCYQASDKVAVVQNEAVNDFTYNIWGDYLFGFDRIGRPKEPSVISPGNDSGSFSFFAKGPAFLENFHPRFVSPFDPEGI